MKVKHFAELAIKNGYTGSECKGWDWIKANLGELDYIFQTEEYKAQKGMKYLCTPFLYGQIELTDSEKSAIDTAWYLNNERVREAKEKKEYEEREARLFGQGYRKIQNTQKELHGLKVKCNLDCSKIGLLGSFDAETEKEGKLYWTEGYGGVLMLIPKRCRSKGHIIKDYAYIKEVI